MTGSKVRGFLWGLAGVVLVVRTAVRDRGVIYDHLEFGRRLFSGAELYAPYLDPKPLHPVYPPSFGLMTAPFALFPDAVARTLWAIVQVVALAWIGIWLARALAERWPAQRRHVHATLLFTSILASRYVLRDTHGGGGNLINVALVLGSIECVGRGRTVWSALLLGFSLATKPTMVLFAPLLWLLGHGRAAVGAVLTFVGLLAVALLIHGNGLAPLERWASGSLAYGRMPDVFVTPEAGFPPFTWMNQCLRCAVARFGGTVPEEFAAQVPGFFQGLGLGPTPLTWIRNTLAVAILGASFAAIWRRRREPGRPLAAVALLFAVSLLLSPISWKAHHVALIPALFLLIARGMRGARWPWAVAAAYAATCVVGEAIVGKDFKNVQQSLYLTTLGTITMWSLCLWPRFSAPEEKAGDPPGAIR